MLICGAWPDFLAAEWQPGIVRIEARMESEETCCSFLADHEYMVPASGFDGVIPGCQKILPHTSCLAVAPPKVASGTGP